MKKVCMYIYIYIYMIIYIYIFFFLRLAFRGPRTKAHVFETGQKPKTFAAFLLCQGRLYCYCYCYTSHDSSQECQDRAAVVAEQSDHGPCQRPEKPSKVQQKYALKVVPALSETGLCSLNPKPSTPNPEA